MAHYIKHNDINMITVYFPMISRHCLCFAPNSITLAWPTGRSHPPV